MKKTQPRRYNTANDIRAAIDRYKVKAQRLRESAAALDVRADEFIRAGPDHAEDVKWNRSQAQKKRKSADRIEERQLRKLKGKLAEWSTSQLPGIDNGDPSIPVKG